MSLTIDYKKMTTSWVVTTMPLLCVFLAIGFYSVKAIRLPPHWTFVHVMLLVVCIVTYISAFWFCVTNLWVSVKHEFSEQVITKYSLLWFSWARTRPRDDIKESKIIESGGSPFGSRAYLLQLVFNDGSTDPLFSARSFAEAQAVHHQLQAYLAETRQ